jgi:hypothetical protein
VLARLKSGRAVARRGKVEIKTFGKTGKLEMEAAA